MATLSYSSLNELVNAGEMKRVYGSDRGYIPAKWHCNGYPYEGKHGAGYRVDKPNKDGFFTCMGKRFSNRYHSVEYFVWINR